MQAELAFQGGRKDVDKKVADMTTEEKAVFDCLEDDKNVFDGAYEELDDDFLLMLNDGKPALEHVNKPPPMLDSNHENAGVEVLKADEEEEHPMMIANYKDQMKDVIAMLDKQNELRKLGNTKQIESEAKQAVNQKQLDDVFNAFLVKEYQDDQIGDLEDEVIDPMDVIGNESGEEDDMLDYGELSDGDMAPSNLGPSQADLLEAKHAQDSEMIHEAVNEFIQDKKGWFRQLHKDHGAGLQDEAKEKGENFLPGTAKFIGKDLIQVEGDADEEVTKRMLKERTIANEEKFVQEMEERGTDDESEESEPEEQWDAETILTTYTNTDNHPSVIKFKPKVKVNQKAKIELHTQFKVPVTGLDGLIPIAEEVEVKKIKGKKSKPVNAFEEDSSSSDAEEMTEEQALAAAENSEGDGAEEGNLNPRKAAKKAMKAERREKRAQKKELKVAFKNQIGKYNKQQTVTTAGEIRPGVSVRKIY